MTRTVPLLLDPLAVTTCDCTTEVGLLFKGFETPVDGDEEAGTPPAIAPTGPAAGAVGSTVAGVAAAAPGVVGTKSKSTIGPKCVYSSTTLRYVVSPNSKLSSGSS